MKVVKITDEKFDNSYSNILNAIGSCKSSDPLYIFFNDNPELKLLELGCRFPQAITLIYHRFQYSKMVGVDLSTEEKCVQEELDSFIQSGKKELFEKYKNWKSFFDMYVDCYKSDNEDNEKPKITNKIEFDNLITKNVMFNTNITDYLRLSTERFDLILANNVLHFFYEKSQYDELFLLINNSLNTGGMFHFRIQESPYRIKFNYESFKSAMMNYFNEGNLLEYYQNNKWSYSIFNNKLDVTIKKKE